MADSDWKECLDWIKRLDFLELDEPLLKPNLQIQDFAQCLRDGVVLCRLLNRIASGTIDQRHFSQRPQMSQFLCSKNIKAFLTKCQHDFKMIEEDLFEVTDLFDLADFSKVIYTLSLLSHTHHALRSGVKGFQIARDQDYGTLHSLAHRMTEGSDGNNNNNSAYTKYDDKIYQDILSIKRQESMRESVKISQMTKREYCLKEIVDTERNYIGVLQMIVEQFRRPLSGKLPKPHIELLFHGIGDLHVIHNGFYSDLSKACQSRHGTVLKVGHMTISDCFIKWKERFLKYAEYCSNLVAVNSLLSKLLDNAISKAAIVECQEAANGGKFRLSDLLTIPMQRVLRYHLLLKELIKNTDDKHPERKTLDIAHEEMMDLAAYVNEAKRDNENLTNIEAVQHSIVNAASCVDFKTFGRLQMDGELRYKVGEEKKDKLGFMFLFDKVLLICKVKSAVQYSLKECYELMDTPITPLIQRDRFGFHLYMLKSSNNITEKAAKNTATSTTVAASKKDFILVFYAKSEAMCKKWIESFKASIDNMCPPGWTNHKRRFVLTTFPEPTICDVCRKMLRGVFFQGYKCRNTNMSVHKNCISQAKNSSGPPTVPPKEVNGYKARATSSYTGLPPPPSGRPPLPFNEGDLINVLSTESDPWWMGKVASTEGYFLKNFVAIIKIRELDEPQTPGFNQSNNPISFLTPHPSTPIGPSVPRRLNRGQSCAVIEGEARKPNPLTNTLSVHSGAPPLPARGRFSQPTNRSPRLTQPSSPLPPSTSSSFHLDEFFGEDLAVFPWFVGEMSRDRAVELLAELDDGCYLVRISNTADRKGELSLSLKFGEGRNAVKNIKIQRGADKKWFLTELQTFSSVQDTIEHYQVNSLASCFLEVPTTLTTPFKDTLSTPDN